MAYLFILVWSVSFFLATSVYAQKRNPDIILTRKDTMSVKIVEVGLSDVKYTQLTGDTLAIYAVAKANIVRVFYGNGDEEEFKPLALVQPVGKDRRYYKMVVKTPFQKEIAQWSTEKLMLEKELYRQKYIPQKVGGIMAFPVGGVLLAVGFAQAIGSLFDNDGPSGAAAAISGVVIATGLGIPLTIIGSQNKKKYKAIETELEIRRVMTD
jgi:hypothetical protein